MCLYPKLIKNKKYTSTKKNGGNIPPIFDERTKFVPVGCGKCIECKKKKSREWQVRLNEEVRVNENSWFVTLSFNDESLEELKLRLREEPLKKVVNDRLIIDLEKNKDNELARIAVRLFLERWRKKFKRSVRHWFITELGEENERIHIHGIIFTDKNKIKELENLWKYGFVYIGDYVNEKTVNYIIKYIYKTKFNEDFEPKIFTSAGIGSGYMNRIDKDINKFNGNKTKEFYRTRKGTKLYLPIYYRNKLYSEEERERLWINKLEENKRYVLGMEVDVSNGEELYEEVRKEARELNKRLGYGSDESNWDERIYKNQLKKLKYYSKRGNRT